MSRQDLDDVFVCHTRDISERGCFLDTAEVVPPGTRLLVAILDDLRGLAMEVEGEVARCLSPDAEGKGRGLGVRFDQPPEEWNQMVAAYHLLQEQERRSRRLRRRRLRVLVVGDPARQRGAMALYVTSGWDVRFAIDLDGAEDALLGVKLNAVIVEDDLAEVPWSEVLTSARSIQPEAIRVVLRATGDSSGFVRDGESLPLFHQIVDREAGLDALLEALIDDQAV